MAAVSIAASGITPEFQTVHVGDSVTWTNNFSVPKTLRFGGQLSGPPATDELLAASGTYSHTFGVTGHFTFSVDKMTGAIQVI